VNTRLSEYSFANIFLFRDKHDYEVLLCKELPLIKGKTYDGKTFIMPAYDILEHGLDCLLDVKDEADFFFPFDEARVKAFESLPVEISYEDGDSDYIYTSEKMCTYKGRKLHKKRNLLKNFKLDYDHYSKPLTPQDNIEDARYILDKWQEDIPATIEETDYKACLEVLHLYKELAVCGIVYYAEGKPAGFVMGEELNPETFVLHFAKGIRDFRGIYQFMYNSFAKVLPEKYKYINFEQDLGKTALRMAKTSYVPDKIDKKYRVQLV